MKAGERYFMAAVDLLSVKARVERILADLEDHKLPPSMELIAACISNLTDAMLKTHRDRLSDPNFRIPPRCVWPECDDNGKHPLCANHAPFEVR